MVEAAAYHHWLKRHFGIGFLAMRKVIVAACVLTPLTLVGPALMSMTTIADSSAAHLLFGYLALASLAALAGWIAGLFLLNHPLRDELLGLARKVRRRTKT